MNKLSKELVELLSSQYFTVLSKIKPSDILVAIDDGHGMQTPGKRTPIFTDGTKSPDTGKNFMHENEFNRAVAKYLKAHLERLGMRTLMVAPTDADTSLTTRVNTANKAKATIYVSIHANASTGVWNNSNGVETFSSSSANSRRLAEIVQRHTMKGTPQRNRGVKNGNHLHVIRATNMPAILIESGFMDNDKEARLLMSDSFRRETAKEVAQGICEYFGIAWVDEKATGAPVATPPSGNEASKETVKVEPAKPLTVPEKDDGLFRVRVEWTNDKVELGVFKTFAEAKEAIDKKGDRKFKVYDAKGNVLYCPRGIEWYRVRQYWARHHNELAMQETFESAKALAEKNKASGYKVFDHKGKEVYVPNAGKAGGTKEEVKKEEAAVKPEVSTHTVQKGETLTAISKQYGTTVKALKDLNDLDSSTIKVGQILKVK